MTVIATAGHVDHGKSSLVLALTGTDPDRLAEEKRRGMTIDLGFAHTDSLSFVDVPGHIDFLNTMVAGVHGVDIALLVIDIGEGWKPQTVEHLDILMLMQVRHIVVALTKADASTHDATTALVARTESEFASRGLTPSNIIITSAHTGLGLEELRDALTALTHDVSAASTSSPARLIVSSPSLVQEQLLLEHSVVLHFMKVMNSSLRAHSNPPKFEVFNNTVPSAAVLFHALAVHSTSHISVLTIFIVVMFFSSMTPATPPKFLMAQLNWPSARLH
jgi:small GTP-binding protein